MATSKFFLLVLVLLFGAIVCTTTAARNQPLQKMISKEEDSLMKDEKFISQGNHGGTSGGEKFDDHRNYLIDAQSAAQGHGLGETHVDNDVPIPGQGQVDGTAGAANLGAGASVTFGSTGLSSLSAVLSAGVRGEGKDMK